MLKSMTSIKNIRSSTSHKKTPSLRHYKNLRKFFLAHSFMNPEVIKGPEGHLKIIKPSFSFGENIYDCYNHEDTFFFIKLDITSMSWKSFLIFLKFKMF